MIFYFSGTGNSKWIAEEIAKIIKDEVVDITSLKEVPNIENEKSLGFVFPIYAWGAAEPMLKFLKDLPKIKAFTYGICTCGADAGLAMKKLTKVYNLESSYSIVMPSNYIIGSDIEEEKVIKEKISNAKIEIEKIAKDILQHKKVYKVHEGSLAGLKSNLACMGFNKFARSTKPFYAMESCNGCGLCAKNCPKGTIKIIDGKPVWDENCYQCLRCINECPQKAIQYGKKTEKRGRYTIEKYL